MVFSILCLLHRKWHWPTIAGGPSLDYGTTDERIATLAARLATTGDIDGAEPYAATTIMDGRLQDAVRRFQWRHGLETDGVVGPATIRALNVPVEQRVEQLRLTLERARWVLDGIGDDFVVVNIAIAGFRAYVVADRKITWETRVVVGKEVQQTLPVLLLYWTANVDPDGVVHFYRDVYQRDPPMAKALGAPFRIQPPPRPDGLL